MRSALRWLRMSMPSSTTCTHHHRRQCQRQYHRRQCTHTQLERIAAAGALRRRTWGPIQRTKWKALQFHVVQHRPREKLSVSVVRRGRHCMNPPSHACHSPPIRGSQEPSVAAVSEEGIGGVVLEQQVEAPGDGKHTLRGYRRAQRRPRDCVAACRWSLHAQARQPFGSSLRTTPAGLGSFACRLRTSLRHQRCHGRPST